jgi:hypothetical protein
MNMRKGLESKAKKLAFGIGMGAILAVPAATLVSTTAGASATSDQCYTGCSTPSTGLPVTSGDGSAAPTPTLTSATTTTSTPSGLAFTGADLSEMVIISAGALGAGTLLVRVSRRRRQTA